MQLLLHFSAQGQMMGANETHPPYIVLATDGDFADAVVGVPFVPSVSHCVYGMKKIYFGGRWKNFYLIEYNSVIYLTSNIQRGQSNWFTDNQWVTVHGSQNLPNLEQHVGRCLGENGEKIVKTTSFYLERPHWSKWKSDSKSSGNTTKWTLRGWCLLPRLHL